MGQYWGTVVQEVWVEGQLRDAWFSSLPRGTRIRHQEQLTHVIYVIVRLRKVIQLRKEPLARNLTGSAKYPQTKVKQKSVLLGFATLKWEKKEILVDLYPCNPRSRKHFLSERLAHTLLRVSSTQEILSCLVVDMIFFSLERFGGVTITSSSFITIQVAYEIGNDYLFTVASPLPCWMRGLVTSPSKKGFLAGLQL